MCQCGRTLEGLVAQRQALKEFADSEAQAMKHTSEEMIQRLAKVLSKHSQLHAQRVEKTMSVVLAKQTTMIDNVTKLSQSTKEASQDVAATVMDWSKDTTKSIQGIGAHIIDSAIDLEQVRAPLHVTGPVSEFAAR